MLKIDYKDNEQIIESFYDSFGLATKFEKDNIYLKNAFDEIKNIWLDNFDKISEIKYLLIAEAPLWGKKKKYIYNPETNNTQFFYRSDLEKILDISILNKREFIKTCNEIGLLIVDISPFPLNSYDTSINYRKLTKKEYKQLVSLTIPTFFEKKIKLITQKKSAQIKVFFRYSRVKNAFQDLISDVLIKNKLIKKLEDIGDISQTGGGIDRIKLKKIINEI